MSGNGNPQPTREPEIEFLAKAARYGLILLRVGFWGAGAACLAFGCQMLVRADQLGEPGSSVGTVLPSALGTVWITLGIPLVVRSSWILDKGRARQVMLAVSLVLWFAPMSLADDSPYGFILRIFATLVSCLTMLVWRTLWQLNTPSIPSS